MCSQSMITRPVTQSIIPVATGTIKFLYFPERAYCKTDIGRTETYIRDEKFSAEAHGISAAEKSYPGIIDWIARPPITIKTLESNKKNRTKNWITTSLEKKIFTNLTGV